MVFNHSFGENFLIYKGPKGAPEGSGKGPEAQAKGPDPKAAEAAKAAAEKSREAGKEAVSAKTGVECNHEADRIAQETLLAKSKVEELTTDLDDIKFQILLSDMAVLGPQLTMNHIDKLVQFSIGTWNDDEDNLRGILRGVNNKHIGTHTLSTPSLRILLEESDEDQTWKDFITEMSKAGSTADKVIKATDDSDILETVYKTIEKSGQIKEVTPEALMVLIDEMDLETVLKANLKPSQKVGLLDKGELDRGDKLVVFTDLFSEINSLLTLSTPELDTVINFALKEKSGTAINTLQARLADNAEATTQISNKTLIELLDELHDINATEAKEAIKANIDHDRRRELYVDRAMENVTEAWLKKGTPKGPKKKKTPKPKAAKATPAKTAPAKAAPAKEAPAKEAPAKEAPAKEAPEKEAPEKEAPEKEAPEKPAEKPAPKLDKLKGKTATEKLEESGIEVKGDRVYFTIEGAERSFNIGGKGSKFRETIKAAETQQEVKLIVYKRLLAIIKKDGSYSEFKADGKTKNPKFNKHKVAGGDRDKFVASNTRMESDVQALQAAIAGKPAAKEEPAAKAEPAA